MTLPASLPYLSPAFVYCTCRQSTSKNLCKGGHECVVSPQQVGFAKYICSIRAEYVAYHTHCLDLSSRASSVHLCPWRGNSRCAGYGMLKGLKPGPPHPVRRGQPSCTTRRHAFHVGKFTLSLSHHHFERHPASKDITPKDIPHRKTSLRKTTRTAVADHVLFAAFALYNCTAHTLFGS